MGDLMELRHDHHGCRLCVRQRAEAADEIERLQKMLAAVFRPGTYPGPDAAAEHADDQAHRRVWVWGEYPIELTEDEWETYERASQRNPK